MSNFDRVLSDEEADSIVKNTTMLLGQSIARSKDFILKIEQAVLAKLAEQEPVAWYVPENEYIRSNFTGDNHMAMSYEYRGVNVKPLYAHPMPSVSNTSDKVACVSESGESEMQHHLEYLKRYQKWRRGEDKTMTEAGLEPKQIGEALDWLILFAENHIVDKHEMVLEGWQPIDTIPSGAGMPEVVLVATSINSVYTAYSMGGEIGLITPLDGCSFDYKAYGEPNYWMPLPAAPKYTGEK